MHQQMCLADAKRSLEIVVYDRAFAESQQRANKRARQDEAAAKSSSSLPEEAMASASAIVPYVGAVHDIAPINSIVVPPSLRPPPPAAGGREEPPCLRRHFLEALGLRADLPVHFIHDKRMSKTDLDGHQSRFRIPRDGVERHLRPILSPQELDAANLLEGPRRRPRRQEPGPSEPQDGNNRRKTSKKKGKAHGGLPVMLVDLNAGAKELRLSRWDSSQGTIVKGEGYLQFMRQCTFKEGDDVAIWAFVQRRFRLFGVDMCHDSLLHLLVVKKQDEARCRVCRAPAQPES
ncbi:hypothetical protein Zm00014a_007620 [Zea mays]|jgi:hypothetical protein|uniref:B3 domain-containing protein n=3 Tax=Zea mays TaxID=4577 RepID=A0A3L6DS08_MAIZE|nr:hypothetical protein ZEAMMB73_Zm00001d012014 [Zea mays]PWZ11484.1 hypothetical protein Zm00014a_007620 [Zea mays]